MECTNCIKADEILHLKEALEEQEKAHDCLVTKVTEIEKAQAVTDVKYNHLLQILSEIKVSVNEIKERPVKKYDSLVTIVLTAVVSGFIGYLISVVF